MDWRIPVTPGTPTGDPDTVTPGAPDMGRRQGDLSMAMNPTIVMDMSPTNPVMPTADMAMANNPNPGMADMAMAPTPTPTTPTLRLIFTPDKTRTATGLAFHPTRDELWVVNWYDNSVVTISNPGKSNQSAIRRLDPAADHFMMQPTGIAWGAGDTWATCGENNNGGNNFTGPSLFSGDPAIFAVPTANGLGSHLDMLHYSPWCMGIAHESANIYWVFDDFHRSLTKYDFKADHGPGNDNHDDGVIRVYAAGQVLGVEQVPSQLAYNPADKFLYVADTGHKRIVKLDTTVGTAGSELQTLEVADTRNMSGTSVVAVVTSGLDKPSGIALDGSTMWVSDNATSKVNHYSLAGVLLSSFATGLAAGSLAGITVGPDGKVWLVDMKTSKVYRID